jgi:hypothetical protein
MKKSAQTIEFPKFPTAAAKLNLSWDPKQKGKNPGICE